MTNSTRTAIIVAGASLAMIVLLVLGLSLLTPLERADSQSVNAANALVEAGNTVEAIEIYENLLDRGAYDSSLFYNLGNAYMVGGSRQRPFPTMSEPPPLPRATQTSAPIWNRRWPRHPPSRQSSQPARSRWLQV